jgi:hypothetical protein
MPPVVYRFVTLLLATALLPIFCLSAAAGSVFYSVQFAEFKDLRSVNRQVNALQDKEKAVFWEKATMPDTGTFYRVYLGRFSTWEEAHKYGRRLQQSGDIDHFGIHWFTEPEPESIPSADEFRSRIRRLPLGTELKGAKERFVDNENGTVTDLQTGLMWAQNGWRLDLLSALSWDEAAKKVTEFRLAGHEDWRLPTIEEWLSLIDDQNRNPALVAPNPFVNIISHMPYWSATEYTYSRDRTCEKDCPLESYTVMLYTGSVNHQKKSDLAFIMPVRKAARP